MSVPKLVKKITLKEIEGLGRADTQQTKAHFIELAKEHTELAMVVGEMSGYGVKPTQYGDSYFLIGTFFARNQRTGDMLKAGKIYLPKDATENLIAEQKRIDDVVRFKLSVKVVPDPSQGYTYLCEPVADAQRINREAELLAELSALPAPKAQPQLTSKKK